MIRLSRDTLFVQPIPEHLAKHATAGNGAKLHLVYRKSRYVNDCQTKAGHLTTLYHRSTRCCFYEGQLVTLFSPPPPLPLFSPHCINGRQKNVRKTYENGVLHPLKDVGI